MTKVTQQLVFQERLFGRAQATRRLEEIFYRASRGTGELLLLPGRSGVGKTSLARWLKEPVDSQNGWFVEGKFDQYQQIAPYYALRQALSELWREMRRSSPLSPQQLLNRVHEEVGELGGLLVELIPELDVVFGEPAPMREVAHREARYQFLNVIRKFLKLACRPDHPVVMFIDDWQWADTSSLDILKKLQPQTTLPYFLLVASYRDEEVECSHPLYEVAQNLRQGIAPAEYMEVTCLSAEDVTNLISTSLSYPVKKLKKLSSLIYEKTRGNPFYIKSLLEYIHSQGMLYLDQVGSSWEWRLQKDDLPADIVDLFVRRLGSFEAETRRLLSFAACLGNRFQLGQLAGIYNRPETECRALLDPLLFQGLLLQEDGAGIDGATRKTAPRRWCRFLHDRVQQAAFLLIDSDRLADIHLEIGRQLQQDTSEKELDQRLFEILEHCNAAAGRIEDRMEQHRMVALNMRAGRKAKAATAYGAMLVYYRAAFDFARRIAGDIEGYWRLDYQRALVLCRHLAESEFIAGDSQRAERIIFIAIENSKSALERAESLNIMIVHYTLAARYEEAIAAGRKALAELDVELPGEQYERHCREEIAACREFFRGRTIEALAGEPVMEDEHMRCATKLLITLGPPCYRTHQRLWSVIVAKVVNITLHYGLVPQIGYCYTAFGGLLCWMDGDYATARQFGDLAEKLIKGGLAGPSDQSVFSLMVGSSIRHWFAHLQVASRDYIEAYEIGVKAGNLQYAAYAFGHNMYCGFYRGKALEELCRETRQSLVFSKTRLNYWAMDLLEGGLHVFEWLTGGTGGLDQEEDNAYLRRVEAHENIQVRCIYNVLKSFTCMVLGEVEQALEFSEEAERLIYTVGTQGLLPWPEHVICRCLVLCRLYNGMEEARQAEWRVEMNQRADMIATWSRVCPVNYEHKHLLLTAERHRIEGNASGAMSAYDRAIEVAQTSGFIQWEAIANERAGHFWFEKGNGAVAQMYWQQAYTCYRRWGAKAKLQTMEDEYRHHLQSWLNTVRDEQEAVADSKGKSDKEFIARQIDLLVAQSANKLEADQHHEVERKAAELAEATERLRGEVATRKRLEKERSELEEQMRQSRKLESIGTLAGGIAHEFNNMLTVVMGNIELARDDLLEGDPVDDCLQEAQEASARAKGVVEKLQRFARKSQAAKKPHRISDIVEESLTLLRKTIPATVDIRLNMLCDSELVMADRSEMEQVLFNICNNSVQAMGEEPGVLQIDVEPIIPADKKRLRMTVVQHAESYIRLKITDTGCGIEADVLERVFDPYFTTKDVDEGIGMGLAVALGIVKNHEGDIDITSAKDQGTSVTVLLPEWLRDAKEDGKTAATVLPSKNAHILFVDDEEAIVNMNRKTLEKLGYRVTATTRPEEALELFRASPDKYNLVISDVTMPHMTGIKLAAKLRRLRADIPVILSTGHGTLHSDKRMQEIGINAMIRKSAGKKELAATIREVLKTEPKKTFTESVRRNV